MKRVRRNRLKACRTALIDEFRKIATGVSVAAKGYVPEASDNLIKGVGPADFEGDLRQGDGNELKTKFHAVHSSARWQ
jgi:hypothetical protein